MKKAQQVASSGSGGMVADVLKAVGVYTFVRDQDQDEVENDQGLMRPLGRMVEVEDGVDCQNESEEHCKIAKFHSLPPPCNADVLKIECAIGNGLALHGRLLWPQSQYRLFMEPRS